MWGGSQCRRCFARTLRLCFADLVISIFSIFLFFFLFFSSPLCSFNFLYVRLQNGKRLRCKMSTRVEIQSIVQYRGNTHTHGFGATQLAVNQFYRNDGGVNVVCSSLFCCRCHMCVCILHPSIQSHQVVPSQLTAMQNSRKCRCDLGLLQYSPGTHRIDRRIKKKNSFPHAHTHKQTHTVAALGTLCMIQRWQ